MHLHCQSTIINEIIPPSPKENHQSTVCRKSPRWHVDNIPATPTSHAWSTEQVSHSPETPPTTSRKRSRHSDDREAKRRRTDPPSPVRRPTSDEAASQTLSKRNLRKLPRSKSHGQDSIFNWMESSTTSEHARGRRAMGTAPKAASRSSRSRSRNSSSTVTDLISRTTSQRSQNTCSNARYRFDVLTNANIHVEIQSPPDHVQTQIDAIIENEIPATRKEELTRLARDFCDDFARVLRKPAGEDDCVELLYKTLSTMDHRKRLALERKAHWQPCLKPPVRLLWDLSFLNEGTPGNTSNDIVRSVVPQKRPQQAASNYVSPSSSADSAGADQNRAGIEIMPPPPIPSKAEPDRESLKTPRPDISIGILTDVVIEQMQSQGLDRIGARNFLNALQHKTVIKNPKTPPEPMLCSDPTQRGLPLRFPFLIVEGKSHATGNHIFEAENQAAVAGACALKIPRDLDHLVELASRGSEPETSHRSEHEPFRRSEHDKHAKIPLMFSICTQGPFHELWAHYDSVVNEVREFHMTVIASCRAPIRAEVVRWLMIVDNVLTWGSKGFLDGVVRGLGMVAKKVKRTDD